MSLIDDFNESTEASLAPVPASFGDVYAAPNGYGTGFEGGGDNVRVNTLLFHVTILRLVLTDTRTHSNS